MMAKNMSTAVLLQIRGHLARRQFLLAVEGAQQMEEERKRQKQLMQEEHEAQLPAVERVRQQFSRTIYGHEYKLSDCCIK